MSIKYKITIIIFAAIISFLLQFYSHAEPLSVGQTPIIPKQIQSYVQNKIAGRFSEETDINKYIEGFSEGFKSSIVCKLSLLRRLGSKISDIGVKEGRQIGLTDSIPDELKDITLTDYGFTEGTFEGLIYFNFEQSDFRLLNSNEIWWIENCGNIPGYDKPKEELKENFGRLSIYVKVQAYLSQQSPWSHGGYGHMARYDREIFITKVLEIRKSTESERVSIKTRF